MRIPILSYHSMHVDGNDYASNDVRALASDLEHLTEAGFRILPLNEVVEAWLAGREGELGGRVVALSCDDGSDFDFADLPHPTWGVQRSVLNTLRDFRERHPGAAAPHVTSFVIVSPEARAALDAACMIGRGWWSDAWWSEAVASGLMHVGNHSWDHNHEALPESFSHGVRRGTFSTIDNETLADLEIRRAADFLGSRAPNPGTRLFAYPYGDSNPYLAGEYFPRHAGALGIEAAVTDRAGFLEKGTSRWEIPRFMCGRDWSSPAELQAILDLVGDPGRAFVAPRAPGAAMMAPPPNPAPAKRSILPRGSGVRVDVDAPKSGRGLVRVAFHIEGGAPRFGPAYKLSLAAEGSALRYSRAIDLTQGAVDVGVCVNSHLLPNGANTLRASLTQAGVRTLWTKSLAIDIDNPGPLAERVRASLEARRAPLVLDGPVDSTAFDMGNPSLSPWFDRPDAHAHIERLRAAGQVSDEEAAALARFVDDGYVVLPRPLEAALLARIDRELDDAIERQVEGYRYGTSQRIHNLHHRYPGVRALWRHPAVMRYLELIFGVPARPCQSLTYVFGSQQGAHQDTIHLTPFPAGYMCGVWVALEDVKPQSGELEVYRGSHRLPRVYMDGSGCPKVTDDDWTRFGDTVAERWRRMLADGGFEKVTYRPTRGTVLIWHENLMHAGGVRIDTTLSRRSIVSHYFAEGAIAFYDSSGMPGNME